MIDMSHPQKDELMDRRALFVDVDDTLLMHTFNENYCSRTISIKLNGRVFVGSPNDTNIAMLKKFYNLGYDVYVWSRTGESWAKAVSKKLKLQAYVKAYLTKPDFYLDDKEVANWIGPRIYNE